MEHPHTTFYSPKFSLAEKRLICMAGPEVKEFERSELEDAAVRGPESFIKSKKDEIESRADDIGATDIGRKLRDRIDADEDLDDMRKKQAEELKKLKEGVGRVARLDEEDDVAKDMVSAVADAKGQIKKILDKPEDDRPPNASEQIAQLAQHIESIRSLDSDKRIPGLHPKPANDQERNAADANMVATEGLVESSTDALDDAIREFKKDAPLSSRSRKLSALRKVETEQVGKLLEHLKGKVLPSTDFNRFDQMKKIQVALSRIDEEVNKAIYGVGSTRSAAERSDGKPSDSSDSTSKGSEKKEATPAEAANTFRDDFKKALEGDTEGAVRGIGSAFRSLLAKYKASGKKADVKKEVERVVGELKGNKKVDSLTVNLEEGSIEASGTIDGKKWEVDYDLDSSEAKDRLGDIDDPELKEMLKGLPGWAQVVLILLYRLVGKVDPNKLAGKPSDSNETVGEGESEISKLEAQVKDLEGKIAKLKKEGVKPNSADIQRLEAEVQKLKVQIAAMAAKMNTNVCNALGCGGKRVVLYIPGRGICLNTRCGLNPTQLSSLQGFCKKADSGWYAIPGGRERVQLFEGQVTVEVPPRCHGRMLDPNQARTVINYNDNRRYVDNSMSFDRSPVTVNRNQVDNSVDNSVTAGRKAKVDMEGGSNRAYTDLDSSTTNRDNSYNYDLDESRRVDKSDRSATQYRGDVNTNTAKGSPGANRSGGRGPSEGSRKTPPRSPRKPQRGNDREDSGPSFT